MGGCLWGWRGCGGLLRGGSEEYHRSGSSCAGFVASFSDAGKEKTCESRFLGQKFTYMGAYNMME